ncbi:MAG TPA: hypothetical protein VFZ69_14395 [Longimicrobiales bacterium]
MSRAALRIAVAGIVWLPGCAAQPVPPLLPDDFTLQGVPVESDSAELRLTFGAPDSVTLSANPFASDAPLATWHYDGFEIRFAGEPTPAGYLVHEPGERTARGIGVGDPARRAVQLYGEPDARFAPSWTWIDDSEPGLLRVVDLAVEADTIRRIYIGRAVN